MRRILIIGVLFLLTSACATRVPLPDAPPATTDPKAAWARTLAEHVDERGKIDFVGVAAEPKDLETWVGYVARVSPRSHPALFPTPHDRLAYYIDAYNALAMYGVIRSGAIPKQKIRFFLLRRYLVGNEEMSLYALENDVIRPLGEARVHFALNCMAKSCPRLPREPWDAARLEEQLQAAAVEYFNTPYDVQIDDAARRVHVSELMEFYEEDFLKEAPSLIDYVNQFRKQPIPIDYSVEFIPFNWKLNKQPRS
jgi:hypothetical protein